MKGDLQREALYEALPYFGNPTQQAEEAKNLLSQELDALYQTIDALEAHVSGDYCLDAASRIATAAIRVAQIGSVLRAVPANEALS